MSDSENSDHKKTRGELANIRSRSRSREKASPSSKIEIEEEIKEKEVETIQKEPFKLPEAFQRDLPNDLIIYESNEENNEPSYTLSLKTSKERPKINLNYGDNRTLIDEKNKITQYQGVWEEKIKHLISDYEMIDIFRPKGKAKYHPSIIRFMDYRKVKRNYLSSQRELSEVFSRAYFKLNEVIKISDILQEFKGLLI